MLITNKLFYIAGPYSRDPEADTHAALTVHAALLEAGIPSVCPHLSHFVHQHYPQDYERWMALDFALLDRCDVLIRLRGKSPGADREIDRAIDNKTQVLFLPRNDLAVEYAKTYLEANH